MRSLFIVAIFSLIGWSNAEWCPTKYLRFSTRHSFCLPPNPTCQILRTNVSQQDIQLILKLHNDFRSKVAMGNERGTKDHRQLPQAADMMQMEWDDELAEVAQKWTENCDFHHDCDECRATRSFNPGQNLAITSYQCKGRGCPEPSKEPDWTQSITGLYNEVEYYHSSWLGSYVPHDEPFKTSHFTQVIWSRSWKVGCGYSYYKQGGIFKKYYACNYGPGGNEGGQPVYKFGQPCSACPRNTECSASSRGGNTFPGLCKMNNPNTAPAPVLNPKTTLFYCGASSSDPDCKKDVSGNGNLQTVNSVGGNYYSVVLNGGQSTNITFNNLIKPHGNRFCLRVIFRKGPLDASARDQSSLIVYYKLGYSSETTNLDHSTEITTQFRYFGMNLRWDMKTKLSFIFSVPNGAGPHVMDLRKILATDGTC